MRKYIFFVFMLAAIGGAGCLNYDSDYQCKSNDECGVGSEGQTSCAIDTSKCVPVKPIIVTDNNHWRTPKVGQTNFSVELEASSGYPPYRWEFTIGGEPKSKLDWLTLKVNESETNKAKAWFMPIDANSGPTRITEINDTLEITVTVRDNTKQGEDLNRSDNKGGTWIQIITIEDCSTFLDCANYDGCCPITCNVENDNDCSIRCGDGIVSSGETCDTAIGSCPSSCDDGNGCTIDILTNAGTCKAECVHATITECKNGDGCCPTGCNIGNDSDCPAWCGDGVVTSPETCDIGINTGQTGSCPTSCDDGNNCTDDVLTGTAANCDVKCAYSVKNNGFDCGNNKSCWDGICKYAIGNTGAGGGKIFYVYPDGSQYMEAAPSEQSGQWGCYQIDIPTSYNELMFYGRDNTEAILWYIMDGLCNGDSTADPRAATICDNYSNNGKQDWFLPSLQELEQLSNQCTTWGGPSAGLYWSSSSWSGKVSSAEAVNFSTHLGTIVYKPDVYHVWCVRIGP